MPYWNKVPSAPASHLKKGTIGVKSDKIPANWMDSSSSEEEEKKEEVMNSAESSSLPDPGHQNKFTKVASARNQSTSQHFQLPPIPDDTHLWRPNHLPHFPTESKESFIPDSRGSPLLGPGLHGIEEVKESFGSARDE